MNEKKYFGLYCPQHGIWLEDKDSHILYYEDEQLMRAHLEQMQLKTEHSPANARMHLWEVTEIGCQHRTDAKTLPPLSSICVEPVNPFLDL